MLKESESSKLFTFTWTIENYFRDFKKVGESIRSPNFFHEHLDANEFFVNLYPIGDAQEAKGYISCYIWRDLNSIDKKDINYKLEIIDINRRVCYSQSFELAKKEIFSGTRKTAKLSQLMGEMGCTTFTVRLLITLKNIEAVFKTKCIARSTFVLDRYTYMRELKNLSPVSEFRNFNFHNKNLELVMDVPKNAFKIKLQKNPKDPLHGMMCKFCILDVGGINITTKTMSDTFIEENTALEMSSSFMDDLIFNKERFVKESFTLMCDFLFPNGSFSSSVAYIENSAPDLNNSEHTNAICGDFQRLYVDKLLCDVKFRIDSRILLAHRNVLAVRSPVFLAMFSQNMSEKETGEVDIPDVDSDIFDAFLMYFYSGTVDNMDCERALKLAVLADRYQVLSLLDTCSYFLASNITDDNVLEILLTADAIQQKQLKKTAVGYIKMHATNILKSNQWQECIKNNIHMATEVIMQITSDLNNYFDTL